MQTLAGPYATWWDKVRGKTAGWGREEHCKLVLEWFLTVLLDTALT